MKLEINHEKQIMAEAFGFSDSLTDDIEKAVDLYRTASRPKSETVEKVFEMFVDKFDVYASSDNPKTENAVSSYYLYIGMAIGRSIIMLEAGSLFKSLEDQIRSEMKDKVTSLIQNNVQFDTEGFKKHLESDEDDF